MTAHADRTGRTGYSGLWRALPRESGFVLASLPVVIVACVVLWTAFGLGLGLSVVWVGIPILVLTTILARAFGRLELARLRAAGRPALAVPEWRTRSQDAGLLARVRGLLFDPRSWAYWVHGSVVNLIVGSVTWSVGFSWALVSLAGPTAWFWGQFLPTDDNRFWLHTAVLSPFPGYRPERTIADLTRGENIFDAVVGLVLLATLPLVMHLLVLIHEGIARGLLAESRSAALRREAAAAEASRAFAILAEDASLRRLERDIHDGPQQGLLRIQFDLSSAIRALPAEDTNARPLVESALAMTKDTLRELRELAQGFAPPLLQDRGLVPALRSLAARSPVPVATAFEVSGDEPELADVSRSVYFIASELLANVAKHSGAAHASVSLRRILDVGERAHMQLLVEVTDDGAGGAAMLPGHGLAGLDERVSGLRGALSIDSPLGGPTAVRVALPLVRPRAGAREASIGEPSAYAETREPTQ